MVDRLATTDYSETPCQFLREIRIETRALLASDWLVDFLE